MPLEVEEGKKRENMPEEQGKIPAEGPEAPEAEKRQTPEEQKADLERELRKREVLARLEEEASDSFMGRILRSKSFWYAVFGTIFFLFMFFIVRWAARDIGL